METFFANVYAAILRLIPFQTLKAIVIASPGFTRETVSITSDFYESKSKAFVIILEADVEAFVEQLYDYIFAQAVATSNKPLLQSRSKWVKVHSNTSHVHGLVEALRAPEVAKMLQGAKFAREGVGLEKCVPSL